MPSALGPTQTLVLLALSDAGPDDEPLTAQDLALALNAECVEYVGAEAVVSRPITIKGTNAALVKLARRGYAERIGRCWRQPRLTTWAITAAGCDFLVEDVR